VYVANSDSSTVSVIDTATNMVATTIPTLPSGLVGVALTPDGSKVYVAALSGSLSVIATATDAVIATIQLAANAFGVAVSPDGRKVYVANGNFATVSVIDTESNTMIATIPVGGSPTGVTVTPDGRLRFHCCAGTSTGTPGSTVRHCGSSETSWSASRSRPTAAPTCPR